MPQNTPADATSLRIDKWLWQARFFKTRTLAAKTVQGNKVRVNREPTSKAHYSVKPGDVLTFQQGPQTRVIEIVALGIRRGPAPEAQALYKDLAPPPVREQSDETSIAQPFDPKAPAQREAGTGRPTKKQRRQLDQALSE